MYRLGLYEKSMPDALSWEEKLLSAKAAGFNWLEVSIDESEARLARLDWDKKERFKLIKTMNDAGIRIDTMCLSAHRKYPIGSCDPETERRGLEIIQKAVLFAYDVGVRIIQLAGYDVYYEPSDERTVARFGENLRKCVDIASEYGVILGFETMETPFMNMVEKAMRYVSEINSPYLKVYPDVGNLSNGTDDVPGDIAKGRGHIVAVHLKETVPGVFRDMRFGEGQVDFEAVIAALRAQGVSMFNAEFWYNGSTDYMKELQYTNDFLRKYLEPVLIDAPWKMKNL